MTTTPPRRPSVIEPESIIEEADPHAPLPDDAGSAAEAAVPDAAHVPQQGWGAWSVLVSSVAALVVLVLSVRFSQFVGSLIVRPDWIGWTATGLAAIAALAALILIAREIGGLFRLGHLRHVRERTLKAIADGDDKAALRAHAEIARMYRGRDDLRWVEAKLKESAADVMTGLERLEVMERELMLPLDARARDAVADAAKRVAAVTSLSPFLLIDVVVIVGQTAAMLRRIATLYGARPGTIGLMRLGRLAFAQIAGTSLLELSGDLLPTGVVRSLGGVLGRKAGEGLFNATMTARIGTAAIELCRPLPFKVGARPGAVSIINRILAELGWTVAGYAGGQAKSAGAAAAGEAAAAARNAVAGVGGAVAGIAGKVLKK
jgi:putative membrane protein